jgi:ubiquinone/menaquinone biosynthesis C-methylase UbiE
MEQGIVNTSAGLISTKREGAEFWDQNPCGGVWPTYREFMTWIQNTEPYVFSVLKNMNWNGKRVVEVGCGQGTTLNYLPQFGAELFGLDMSLQSIRSAKFGATELGQTDRTRLLQADAEHLPLQSGSFDIAISIGVLHHTSDTAQGIREIHRLLKPGGLAVVMLYRSGNPKWWMTRLLRMYSKLVDLMSGESYVLASRIRARQSSGAAEGTALLELFGVPILKAFSNTQSRKLFSDFSEIRIRNYQPGFLRLADILPTLRPVKKLLAGLDKRTENMWGFYQVIEARK